MIRKQLLVLSSGRSGTSYTSKVFQRSGYDLGHEVMGEYGTCSMYCVPPKANCDYKPKTPNREDYKFESIMYQIRNPLRSVESIGNCFTHKVRLWSSTLDVPLPGRAAKRICPISDKLKWAMLYWLEVDDRCRELCDDFYPIEEGLNVAYPTLNLDESKVKTNHNQGLRFAFKSKKQVAHIKETIGTLTYQDLNKIDKDLSKQIQNRATKYGY